MATETQPTKPRVAKPAAKPAKPAEPPEDVAALVATLRKAAPPSEREVNETAARHRELREHIERERRAALVARDERRIGEVNARINHHSKVELPRFDGAGRRAALLKLVSLHPRIKIERDELLERGKPLRELEKNSALGPAEFLELKAIRGRLNTLTLAIHDITRARAELDRLVPAAIAARRLALTRAVSAMKTVAIDDLGVNHSGRLADLLGRLEAELAVVAEAITAESWSALLELAKN